MLVSLCYIHGRDCKKNSTDGLRANRHRETKDTYITHLVNSNKEKDVGIARRGIELGVTVREMIPGRLASANVCHLGG